MERDGDEKQYKERETEILSNYSGEEAWGVVTWLRKGACKIHITVYNDKGL